jgi:hypothetical protein
VAISGELTFGPKDLSQGKGPAVKLGPTQTLPTWLGSRPSGSLPKHRI